ncbi:GNAT family N-acetyltransferase [Actinopolymorpha sp. NPDC004070]|uniref:GNAT family N-acetyltransferase n=1 Tax=Actinopolymorpha sp. NPDC004070 TaxID=3154548 RepID=UPI0033B30B6C
MHNVQMRLYEVRSTGELRSCADDDTLVLWAAQGFGPGVRGWRRGDAVAVASPGLSRRDRLAVHGPPDLVVPLVAEVLTEVGPTYRPIGSAALVEAVAGQVPGLSLAGKGFGWMQTSRPSPSPRPDGAGWLELGRSGLATTVTDLLAEAHPESYATPGVPGVRRWAGAWAETSEGRTLAAVAADAWSAPEVGYVAGVGARSALRGRGYAAAAFGLVLDTLVAEHGRAGLMVETANTAAVGLYRRCGLSWRPLAAAAVDGAPGCGPGAC